MSVYANKLKEVKSAAITDHIPQQHKNEKAFLVDNRPTAIAQRKLQETQSARSAPIQKRKNETGLPDNLKAGVETLSGMGMDDVKVHYNSSQPAQLQALAYAQGTDIHIAPGQEKHLPHEAWHVAQQKQGRVKSNFQLKKGININDDAGLESEADKMGDKALQMKPSSNASTPAIQRKAIGQTPVVQRVIGMGTPAGTKVINKTTKQVYVIARYTQHGYELIHNAVINTAPKYVLPTDADFDIFAEADVREAPAASTSLLSSFSSMFSSSSAPSTTSGAHEKARGGDIAKAWPKITPQVNAIKQEAINNEKLKPGASAFYNAAGLGAHTLHRIILAIYEEVHGVSTRNHVFFRAPGNAPRPNTLEGPQSFLDTRKPRMWSDHQERESLMSANISVSANTADTSESTFAILQSGGLFDVEPKKTVEIIGKMLQDMGITGDYAAIILGEVDRLAKSIAQIKDRNGRENTEAVLYQTFIPKTLISKLVYIAQKNGHPLNEISTLNPGKALLGIAAAGKELKNASMLAFGNKFAGKLEAMSPDERKALFQSDLFTHMVLDATKAESFWAVFNGDHDPQARILMDPKVFAEPSGQVETMTYSNLSRSTTGALETGLTTVKGAVKHVKQQLVGRINDRMEIYGAVFVRFHKLQSTLAKLPMADLQDIFRETTLIIAKVDGAIQRYVADFIEDHPQLKPIITAGLMVKCRGKQEKFDLDTPARMYPEEFGELRALFVKLSTPSESPAPSSSKVPDLLTF